MSGKTLNFTQLSEAAGIPRRTLYRMVEDQRFPVRPIPGTKPRKWNNDDVQAWRRGEYQ